jgi:imidazolonepropionase-like amidohydrolase
LTRGAKTETAGARLLTLVLATSIGTLGVGPQAGASEPSPPPREPIPFTLDAYPSTYRPLPRADVLIQDATVLDGTGRRLEHTDVMLRDGRIAAIGKTVPAPPGVQVINASGRWVTPGIVDMHSHDGDFSVPLTPDSLADVNEISDANSANVWAEHSVAPQDPSFRRALAGGVTTLQVLPGSLDLFGGRSVILKNVPAVTVQAMKFPGAAYGMKMACGENPKMEYGAKGHFPSSRMGDMAGYREAWLRAKRYKIRWERYAAGDEDRPPERDLRLDTLAGVLDGKIRVQMHCYRAEEMAAVIDMSHEMGYHVSAFHHAVEAYKVADLLKREDICAAVWPDWWGYKMEAYDGIRENAALLDQQGVCVAMHSDSPLIGERLNVEAGKAMAAGRRYGLDITPERAIRWITYYPAKAIGLEDRIGSLEVDKNADVVVWSADPFSVYTKTDQVFIDGAKVYDRHDPTRQPGDDFELGQPVDAPQ